jgi:hypothetical protein
LHIYFKIAVSTCRKEEKKKEKEKEKEKKRKKKRKKNVCMYYYETFAFCAGWRHTDRIVKPRARLMLDMEGVTQVNQKIVMVCGGGGEAVFK